MTKYALGIDIGGTFTDIVLHSATNGVSHTHKELTTHDDPSRGVIAGLARLLERHDVAAHQIERVVHATTLFTNALIERNGAVTGLVTTKGFADTLEIGRERKYDLYDVKMRRPEVLVPRNLRREVSERIGPDGDVLNELDEAELVEQTRFLVSQGVQSVAVVFLHSFANPAHEIRACEVIRSVAPDLLVTPSYDVAPEIREYERSSTTVINAYIRPLAQTYLDEVVQQFRDRGVNAPFHLMLSNGGLAHVDEAKRAPVQLLESGPAAGALSAAHFGSLDDEGHLMAFDMGGTTAKLSLIEDGQPSVSFSFEAARAERFAEGSGLPVLISTVDLIEIGAGGGSLSRRDELGLLKVGPRSAGSLPGPAAYGLGGTEATVTDADFFLGYLDPATFAAGTVPIDVDACRAAIGKLAADLSLSPLKAAWGIYDIVNENMAGAARVHFAERGKDPMHFALMATGGAGPVHAYYVAKKLNLRRLICPGSAGVASALGLLVAPARADRALTVGMRTDSASMEALEARFRDLEQEARAVIEETGLGSRQVDMARFADGRFVGQGFNLTVELPPGPYEGDEDAVRQALIERFRQAYREKFTHTPPNMPVEFINIRVSARCPVTSIAVERGQTVAPAEAPVPKSQRPVYFPEVGGFGDTAVYDRAALCSGMVFAGPAVIEDAGSTLVVGPGATISVTGAGNLIVDLPTARQGE